MANINKLTLVNYKSLRSVEFEMKPLNILIGPNGAGKSNLLSFFRLFSDAADGHLADSIRAMGGVQEIRWRGATEREAIEWEIQFEELAEVDNDRVKTRNYNGEFVSQGNSFTIHLEEVSRDPYPGRQGRYKFLSASEGYPRILQSKTQETETSDYAYNAQELLIAQLRDPVRYPRLDEIRRLLIDWTVFRGFGENALQNLHNAQPLDVKRPLRLNPQGTNLVSVLNDLENEAHYAKEWGDLQEILHVAFPDFARLDLKTVASGMVALYWRSRDFSPAESFPARAMSDGMLRFLGLATLLLLPEPPALIAIDEPEIGLHPKLITILAELLKDASYRTQIVVTTHSPQLLSVKAIELEDVVLIDREHGETTLERADSRPNLDRWLERYTLGNLWTMGKLER